MWIYGSIRGAHFKRWTIPALPFDRSSFDYLQKCIFYFSFFTRQMEHSEHFKNSLIYSFCVEYNVSYSFFFCVEREIILLCHCIDFAIALNTALLLNAVIHLRFSSIGSPFTAHRNVLFTFFSHERNSEYFKNLFIAFERCILLTSNVMSLRRPFFYLQCTMVFVASLRRCIEHSVIATNTASSRCCVNTLTATVAIFFFFRIFLEWLK